MSRIIHIIVFLVLYLFLQNKIIFTIYIYWALALCKTYYLERYYNFIFFDFQWKKKFYTALTANSDQESWLPSWGLLGLEKAAYWIFWPDLRKYAQYCYLLRLQYIIYAVVIFISPSQIKHLIEFEENRALQKYETRSEITIIYS